MILKLLPISVVLFSCVNVNSTQSDHQNYKQTVERAYDSSSRIYGNYNWQSEFSGLRDFFDNSSYADYSIDFEPNYLNDYRFLNPCWIDDYYYYCRKIDFHDYSDYVECEVFVYSRDDFRTSYVFTYNDGWYVNDIAYEGTGSPSYYDFIINVREPYYADSEVSQIFNLTFTHDDNAYTTTYSGYYNFATNISSIGYKIGVFGITTFNNNIYYGFTNSYYGTVESSKLFFEYYDADVNSEFSYYTYDLPFDKQTVLVDNLLFNGVKMSINTYTRLSNRGVFAYQRDTTYDDTDFEGLLFTIADTPVYFLSQFLNFELFGMNLFLALSGLITLIIVIFILKKVHTLG